MTRCPSFIGTVPIFGVLSYIGAYYPRPVPIFQFAIWSPLALERGRGLESACPHSPRSGGSCPVGLAPAPGIVTWCMRLQHHSGSARSPLCHNRGGVGSGWAERDVLRPQAPGCSVAGVGSQA